MSKGSVSAHNKEMAKHLKARGVRRTTCRCPICHHLVGLSGLENHIRTCQG